jgi:hypothetical protein
VGLPPEPLTGTAELLQAVQYLGLANSVSDIGLCLVVNAWFWLVAALTISIQRHPVLTVVLIVAAVWMFYAGYCCGWADRKAAELHEDNL